MPLTVRPGGFLLGGFPNNRTLAYACYAGTQTEDIEGASVLNDVEFTQVCATFGTDQRTEEVVRRLLADGTAWMSGSTWRDQSVLRISVSNWSTTHNDVERSLEAVRKAVIGL